MLYLLLLVGCRGGPGPPLAHCAGSDPGPVPGYDAYRWSEVDLPDGVVDAANWAWHGARQVTVNVDVGSFARVAVSADALLATVDRAITFWNDAADISLVLGDTTIDCCTGEGSGRGCRECGAEDGVVDVLFAAAADEWGLPAYTLHTLGDDPATPEPEPGCLVASTVRFFPSGRADGRTIRYEWVDRATDVSDYDPSDGRVDKPIHDTLVHELGHVVGLGDQADDSVACSVMAGCADRGCGCDFEVLGPVDDAALGHVYGR